LTSPPGQPRMTSSMPSAAPSAWRRSAIAARSTQCHGLLMIVLGKGTKLPRNSCPTTKCTRARSNLAKRPTVMTPMANWWLPCRAADDGGRVERSRRSLSGRPDANAAMVSAVKIKGVPLYKMARKGIEVERKARLIHIYHFEFSKYVEPIGFSGWPAPRARMCARWPMNWGRNSVAAPTGHVAARRLRQI